MTRALLVAAVLLSAGCEEERTQVTIELDADPAVNATRVELRIFGGPAGRRPDEIAGEYMLTVPPWPITHAVVPRDDDPTRQLRVEAFAFDSAGVRVGEVRAITGFIESRTLVLRLRFYEACITTMCGDMETCDERGECRSEVVDPRTLPELGEDPRGPDAGATDAGSTDGATIDAPRDGGGAAGDAASDAGPPCEGWDLFLSTMGDFSPHALTTDGAAVYFAGSVNRSATLETFPIPADTMFLAKVDGCGELMWLWTLENGPMELGIRDLSIEGAYVLITGSYLSDVSASIPGLTMPASRSAYMTGADATAGSHAGSRTMGPLFAGEAFAIDGPTGIVGGADNVNPRLDLVSGTAIVGSGMGAVTDVVGSPPSAVFAVGHVDGELDMSGTSDFSTGRDGFVLRAGSDLATVDQVLVDDGMSETMYLEAAALAAGRSDRVYVTGTRCAGGVCEAIVFHATYTGTTLALSSIQALVGRRGSSIAVRSDGAVYVVTQDTSEGYLIRLDSETLAEQWRADVDGAAGTTATARVVVVGSHPVVLYDHDMNLVLSRVVEM